MNEKTTDTQDLVAQAQQLCRHIETVIYDRGELIKLVVATFFAGGHILLEGLPGLGKTELSKALAEYSGLQFKRIQFTPDLLPADITGSHILEETPEGRKMRFMPGPVFSHFLLADEINRGSPKTQSALLEAMGEGCVTQLGETRKLTLPFTVMATQNPIELEGTNPLPEAQLDRFAVKIIVSETSADTLFKIITRTTQPEEKTTQCLNESIILRIQQQVREIFLPNPVAQFIAEIVHATHDSQNKKNKIAQQIRFGVSPRGAIWLAKVAKALAFLDGRSGVGFEDVIYAAKSVLCHRMQLHYHAKLDGIKSETLIAEIIKQSERKIIELSS